MDKRVFQRLIKDESVLLLLPADIPSAPQGPAQLYRALADFRFEAERSDE